MKNFFLSLYRFPPVHRVMFVFAQMLKVAGCRVGYRRVLRRVYWKLRNGKKLKVLFLADDPSKWKYQSVYEEMERTGWLEPWVAIGLRRNHDYELPPAALKKDRADAKSFYERMGCRCVMACNPQDKSLIALDGLGADIVFYQEPWMLFGAHTVRAVSRTALTCYVPYSIEWEYGPQLHWLYDFHRLLFADFVWSAEQAARERPNRIFLSCCKVFGIGHTSLDGYVSGKRNSSGELVIYAPHFAFPHKNAKHLEVVGTFEWNGREMLAYAKRHPEIEWVWKPHPSLRWQLEAKGFMTREEVNAYYAEWESIGRACYDGDYFDLFVNSRAMITDCASFLFEYAPTGMPIIRALADKFTLTPSSAAQRVLDTYYTVRDWNEMERAINEVIINRNDFKKDVRLKAVEDAKLAGGSAAVRVVEALRDVLTR